MVCAKLILAPFWVAPKPSGQTGARTGHFLIKGLLAGAPELALARLGPKWSFSYERLISRNTRTGAGQTGAGNGPFLISGLMARTPELALARLGPETVMFLLGAY